MCKAIEDMRRQEREECRLETKLAVARRMLSDGILALEKIAEYAGLSLDEVKNL